VTQWDRPQIDEGMLVVARALKHPQRGTYVLEAVIAGLHAQAPSADETDWAGIDGLYRQLMLIAPSPVVALNHAVAVAMSRGPTGSSGSNDLLQTASSTAIGPSTQTRAELLRRLGRAGEALPNYERALAMTSNQSERQLLINRIASLSIARSSNVDQARRHLYCSASRLSAACSLPPVTAWVACNPGSPPEKRRCCRRCAPFASMQTV
jgi:RNA polymerase sigma-70 factor (ECF subfamily)